jgi:hypothetical protein
MSDPPSPVKIAGRGEDRLLIGNAVLYICQVFSSEQLSSSTSKGRFALISAIAKRKDEVYRRLVDEFKTIENVHTE